MKRQQHLIRVWSIVSQQFIQMMHVTPTSYALLSMTMVVLAIGFLLLNMVAPHLSIFHALGGSLQLLNKVPFGEPWPRP